MTRSHATRLSSLTVPVVIALLAGTAPAAAESAGDPWQFTLAPYVWATSLDGTTVIKGQEADVDISASDIWDHLDFAAMLMFVARKGNWAVAGDIVTVDLSVEKGSPPVEFDPTLSVVTVQAARRLSPFADLTFGARYNRLEGRLDFGPPIDIEVDKTRDWIDPVVGVVLRTTGERIWHATLVADIGGTGSDDTTWQFFPSLGIDMAKWASFEIGYRLMDTHYETGDGPDRFEYDVLAVGPVLGVAFRF
jgi:hypothetical protein